MEVRVRGETGKFVAKSDEYRQVRSVRLTDSTWKYLGDVASERGETRADLIEFIAKNHVIHETELGTVGLLVEPQQLSLVADNLDGLGLTSSGLAKRLSKSASGIRRSKNELGHNFRFWSAIHDPDDVLWKWVQEKELYFPVKPISVEMIVKLRTWIKENL